MTHFCPPGLGQIMMHTVDCIHEIIEFIEQLLSVRLPFSCFKAVFVNESYADFLSFAGVSIFSVGLLYSEKIIDQVPKTMRKFPFWIKSFDVFLERQGCQNSILCVRRNNLGFFLKNPNSNFFRTLCKKLSASCQNCLLRDHENSGVGQKTLTSSLRNSKSRKKIYILRQWFFFRKMLPRKITNQELPVSAPPV